MQQCKKEEEGVESINQYMSLVYAVKWKSKANQFQIEMQSYECKWFQQWMCHYYYKYTIALTIRSDQAVESVKQLWYSLLCEVFNASDLLNHLYWKTLIVWILQWNPLHWRRGKSF